MLNGQRGISVLLEDFNYTLALGKSVLGILIKV